MITCVSSPTPATSADHTIDWKPQVLLALIWRAPAGSAPEPIVVTPMAPGTAAGTARSGAAAWTDRVGRDGAAGVLPPRTEAPIATAATVAAAPAAVSEPVTRRRRRLRNCWCTPSRVWSRPGRDLRGRRRPPAATGCAP
jgi:hypothetical protein